MASYDNVLNEFEIIRQVSSILASAKDAPETTKTIEMQDTASQIMSGSAQSRQKKRLKSAISYAAPSNYDSQSLMTKVSTVTAINRLIGTSNNVHKTDRLKLGMRIWSGLTKFIRSQCAKDRIIDSIYLGTYYKHGD